MTTVVGFGIEDYAEVLNPEVYKEEIPIVWNSGMVHIVPFIHNLPLRHYEYFKDKYYFSKDYSRTINDYYFANHCEHCKTLQGNYFLFNEVDSPFFIIDTDDARELDLLKINLNNDIISDLEPGYSDTDPLIKQYANIQKLSL